MSFLIILGQFEGVELILKALCERANEKGCIASEQLAEGIEKNLLATNEKNEFVKANTLKDKQEITEEPKHKPKCICRGFYKPKHCPVHGDINNG